MKIARKLLASFLLAASTFTTPSKRVGFSLSTAGREVPDGGYVRLQCHRSYPDGTNWRGDYVTCRYKDELLKKTHMELPVYIGTSDPVWAREQARALDFWQNKEWSVRLKKGRVQGQLQGKDWKRRYFPSGVQFPQHSTRRFSQLS